MAAKKSGPEVLQEYSNSAGLQLRVDRNNCVVHGVKVLGLQSQNDGGKREYLRGAAGKAVAMYEGAPVFVDHAKKGTPRSYRDRIGHLTNPHQEADGCIYADHAYNPKHPITEQYLDDAERHPENVGFSHDVDAIVTRKDGKVIVEEITAVHSVDLVARPATNRSLFESEEVPEDQREFCEHCLSAVSDARLIVIGEGDVESKKARLNEVLAVWQAELAGQSVTKGTKTMDWKDVTIESLKENRKDLVEVLTGTDAASKLQAEIKALKEADAAKDKLLKDAADKLAAIEAEKAATAREAKIAEELKAAGLNPEDKVAVSEVFMANLKAADDAARKALIEDRVAMVGTRREHKDSPPFGSMTPAAGFTPAASVEELLKRL